LEQLMQTDAAINLGNSGGPLANSEDKHGVIPFAQGIGFAITIEPATWVTRLFIEKGEIVRPWSGITAIDLNPQIVEYTRSQSTRRTGDRCDGKQPGRLSGDPIGGHHYGDGGT